MRIKLNQCAARGFTYIELMLVVVISVSISLALYQVLAQVNKARLAVTAELELQLTQQQLWYWFRHTLAQAGRYLSYHHNDQLLQWQQEQQFIEANPIAFNSLFPKRLKLTSKDGNNDVVVLNSHSQVGCNGQNFSYQDGELFHLVNEVFVQNQELRCRSYDGRFLLGMHQQGAIWSSVSVATGVTKLQAKYLVAGAGGYQFLDAADVQPSDKVKALKVELWLQSNRQVTALTQQYAWFTEPDSRFSSKFELTRLLFVLPLNQSGH